MDEMKKDEELAKRVLQAEGRQATAGADEPRAKRERGVAAEAPAAAAAPATPVADVSMQSSAVAAVPKDESMAQRPRRGDNEYRRTPWTTKRLQGGCETTLQTSGRHTRRDFRHEAEL